MRRDIDFIRSQFPAFREPSLVGWSYFENAGGSYMCQQVIDRLLTSLLDFFKARNDVFIVGPDEPDIRAPTVTILPLDKPVPAVVAELEKQKLMVASGDFDVV